MEEMKSRAALERVIRIYPMAGKYTGHGAFLRSFAGSPDFAGYMQGSDCIFQLFLLEYNEAVRCNKIKIKQLTQLQKDRENGRTFE